MWSRLLTATGIAICIQALASTAPQADDAFVFGKDGSHIEFVVHHGGFSLMKGTFKDFCGQLSIDPARPQDASVEVTVLTASIDAGHSFLDGHLRSRDFFDVERFPTMAFKSKWVELIDKDRGRIQGELTLLGKTHPLVLEVTLADATGPAGTEPDVASFTATGTMTRTAFGMDWGPDGFAEDVDIRIEVAAQRI